VSPAVVLGDLERIRECAVEVEALLDAAHRSDPLAVADPAERKRARRLVAIVGSAHHAVESLIYIIDAVLAGALGVDEKQSVAP
jgi:hypothetical protein